ncbi:MAG: lanthionine synthetase LanC family protein, partial [Sarcina sp.]
MGYVAHAASCNGVYYQNLLSATNKYLNNSIQRYINQLEKSELCDYHYDVFSGVAGIGRYLLKNVEKEECYNSLIIILNYIVKTSKEKKWLIENRNIVTEYKKNLYKLGYKDLGLAHGIAGPLQLLGLCYNKGIKVENMKEVISELVDL